LLSKLIDPGPVYCYCRFQILFLCA
jgi:hypothetical protein